MAYKIAVGSSDGVKIDESFGSAKRFLIYEADGEDYRLAEERAVPGVDGEAVDPALAKSIGAKYTAEETADLQAAVNGCGPAAGDCGSGGGCGTGGGAGDCGTGGGCGGAPFAKVGLIDDCRAIVCKKIGFNVQKQLEKKAISAFDVSCSIDEALKKITYYYSRVDRHETFRREP